jgi:hypothetical protein
MPSKYDALAAYLRRQSGPAHTMSFADIERLIGTPLPDSSHTHSAWWGNDRSPDSTHTQAKYGWLAAGWDVESVDPNRRSVTFRK